MKSLLLTMLLLPVFASAHKGHEHALTATAKAAVLAAENVAAQGAAAVGEAAKVAPKLDWTALIKASMSSHLHNKIVHFPVALGLVGMLLLLMSYRSPGLRPGARWVLFFAAAAAVAAIVTGNLQEDDVTGTAAKQVLEVHGGLGWATCIGLWLVLLLSFIESTKKWLWALILILALVILATGTLGGALAHMNL